MKVMDDSRRIECLRHAQRGVFTTADLRTTLADPHPASLTRRISRLIDQQVLRRFARGFYVTEDFQPELLVGRMAPTACISFETVLAAGLVIGPQPSRRLVATRSGPARSFATPGLEIEFVTLADHLAFGCVSAGAVRRANLEKATLDTLYFHLRGRRFAFDIYSDLNLTKLDRARLNRYLMRYPNPKFRTFARGVLELS